MKLNKEHITEIRRRIAATLRGLARYEDGSYEQNSTEEEHLIATAAMLESAVFAIKNPQ